MPSPTAIATSTPRHPEQLSKFDPPLDLPVIKKRRRLTGDEYEEFRTKVLKAYMERRASINDICVATTRSYGAIHKLLVRSGGEMRPPGGARVTVKR
ncbi:helix-turn-helix domain-containing protein [Streptomyces sp. NPDC047525]|uniref:helix-turn-helix domain-containing protein n=1 Tax=Streptomyces sp. NPDC047525 TaxID=3155264 RepID=UPI0033F72817